MWNANLFVATVAPCVVFVLIGIKAGNPLAVVASLVVGAGAYFGVFGVEWLRKKVGALLDKIRGN